VVVLGPERVREFDVRGLPPVHYDAAVARTAQAPAAPPPTAPDGPGHW
jgi:hypothetical protein